MLSGEYKGNKGALGVNVKEPGGGGSLSDQNIDP
jgi:hypothetical protein